MAEESAMEGVKAEFTSYKLKTDIAAVLSIDPIKVDRWSNDDTASSEKKFELATYEGLFNARIELPPYVRDNPPLCQTQFPLQQHQQPYRWMQVGSLGTTKIARDIGERRLAMDSDQAMAYLQSIIHVRDKHLLIVHLKEPLTWTWAAHVQSLSGQKRRLVKQKKGEKKTKQSKAVK